MLVTPVVSLLTDLSVLDHLHPCEGEVDLIFDHPLEAILEPSLSVNEPLVPLNSELWPSDIEYYVRIYQARCVVGFSIGAYLELCR